MKNILSISLMLVFATLANTQELSKDFFNFGKDNDNNIHAKQKKEIIRMFSDSKYVKIKLCDENKCKFVWVRKTEEEAILNGTLKSYLYLDTDDKWKKRAEDGKGDWSFDGQHWFRYENAPIRQPASNNYYYTPDYSNCRT